MALPAELQRGRALLRSGKTAESIAALERVVRSYPESPEAHGLFALALWESGRLAEADAEASTALVLDPDCVPASCTRGLVAQSRFEPAAALVYFDRALAQRPDHLLSLTHAAACSVALGDHERGLARYESALRFVPAHPHARFGRALIWLSVGRFADGWLEYEWRFLTGALTRPNLPRPRWDGSDPTGRHLLVHTEQGIGDVLQLVRFLPRLTDQGAEVSLACPTSLQALLARTPGIDRWFPIDEAAPVTFDLVAPIGSLPGLLGIDEHSMASNGAYVFPEPDRVERWRPRVVSLAGVKVGICWQGSPTFVGDAYRSIPVRHYRALAEVDGVRLVSLQKTDGATDLIDSPDLGSVVTLDGLDTDAVMADTAAVMQHLDLVITSDTAIAHLAGAMGVPVWVALSTAADWRWLRGRSDSPWYPSMRLFRQTTLGDWDGVFTAMAAALRQVVAGDASPGPVPPPTRPATTTLGRIEAPISAGELFDKVSILRLKAARVADPKRVAIVRRELDGLEAARRAADPRTEEFRRLVEDLDQVNAQLWDLEDAVRDCERRGDFGPAFVEHARATYLTNDRRAEIKQQINELLGSTIVEVKSYSRS